LHNIKKKANKSSALSTKSTSLPFDSVNQEKRLRIHFKSFASSLRSCSSSSSEQKRAQTV